MDKHVMHIDSRRTLKFRPPKEMAQEKGT